MSNRYTESRHNKSRDPIEYLLPGPRFLYILEDWTCSRGGEKGALIPIGPDMSTLALLEPSGHTIT